MCAKRTAVLVCLRRFLRFEVPELNQGRLSTLSGRAEQVVQAPEPEVIMWANLQYTGTSWAVYCVSCVVCDGSRVMGHVSCVVCDVSCRVEVITHWCVWVITSHDECQVCTPCRLGAALPRAERAVRRLRFPDAGLVSLLRAT